MSRPESNLTYPHFNTIWEAIGSAAIEGNPFLSYSVSDKITALVCSAQCHTQHLWPCTATPKLQISRGWNGPSANQSFP